jgi:hypothetical protein
MEIIILTISIVIFIWFVILTYLVFNLRRHYNDLTKGVSKRTLMEILEKIVEKDGILENRIENLEKEAIIVRDDSKFHLQKIGLVRFNPFADTGGSQSFTVALLDNENSGVVMTSLYARMGNRWYIKIVEDGKGIGYELSKEETEAITKAKKGVIHSK